MALDKLRFMRFLNKLIDSSFVFLKLVELIHKTGLRGESVEWNEYCARRFSADWLSSPIHKKKLDFVKEFLKPSQRVLDEGCGGFEPLYVYNRDGGVCLDISTVALRHLKEGDYRGELVCGSITHPPFRDGAFEKVVASEVIEHLSSWEDVKRAVREGIRVSGENVLFTTPNGYWYDPTHMHIFTKKRWIKLLKDLDIPCNTSKIIAGDNLFVILKRERQNENCCLL